MDDENIIEEFVVGEVPLEDEVADVLEVEELVANELIGSGPAG